MKRCSRCIVRDNSPGIQLDDSGVCNTCRIWDQVQPTLTDYPQLQQTFKTKLEATSGKFPYDVVVGLSGGKDGSYLVYMLKEIYHQRVLAVTFDAGFMPNDFSKANVERVIKKLGVDHQYVKVPDPIVRKLFRGYFRNPMHTTPCHMCTSVMGLALAFKFAVDNNVPKLVTGADRGQLLGKLHLRHAYKRVFENIAPFDPVASKKQATRMLQMLHVYLGSMGLNSAERAQVLPHQACLPGTDLPPEVMMYFLYHLYDEEAFKRLLEEKVGWIRPSGDIMRGHFDCELKKVAGCAAASLDLGYRLEYELSVDIREGKLSREQALSRLEQERQVLAKIDHPYKGVETYFGMSEIGFERRVRWLSKVAPFYAQTTNALLRVPAVGKKFEKLVFLIRPH